MFFQFFLLEWKSFLRQANFRQSLIVKMLLFALGIIILATLWQFGQRLYDVLEMQSDAESPFYLANRLIVYWLLAELLLRFFMQQLPVIDSKPLLIQPVPRKLVAHYLLFKSFFTYYNLLTPLLFIPFASACIAEGDFSPAEMVFWQIGVIASSLCVHLVSFIVQQQAAQSGKSALVLVAVAVAIYVLNQYDVLAIPIWIARLYDGLPSNPWLLLVPFALLIGAYFVLHHSIASHLYLKVKSSAKRSLQTPFYDAWTKWYGDLRPLIGLDLQLLTRNKRSKSHLITMVIALLYGVIFYREGMHHSTLAILVGIFMTGGFMFNFGQFIPAWDSSYYSLIQVMHMPFRRYLSAKVALLYTSVILSTLLTIPYAFLGTEYLWINISCALFNMGINLPIILFAGSFNKKRIALDKSQLFNYQGIGAAQWLLIVPILILPMLIWSLANTYSSPNVATVVLAAMGIVGMISRKTILNWITARYKRNKYQMLKGFKET